MNLTTDDTDEYGNGEGDHHPNHCNATGALELILAADRHKAKQYLRHTKVAKPPRHGGADGQKSVAVGSIKQGLSVLHDLLACLVEGGICKTEEIKKSGDFLGVGDHLSNAACGYKTDDDNGCKGNDHNDALHKVRGTFRQESAQNGVDQNEEGTQEHHGNVACAEQSREELSAGYKAACRVNRKEDQNERRRDGHDQLSFFAEAVGEELGKSNGVVRLHAVTAQTLGNDEPVEVGANGKSDGSPSRVGKTEPVGNAGQTHEQPSAHVGSFGTHCGDPRT